MSYAESSQKEANSTPNSKTSLNYPKTDIIFIYILPFGGQCFHIVSSSKKTSLDVSKCMS